LDASFLFTNFYPGSKVCSSLPGTGSTRQPLGAIVMLHFILPLLILFSVNGPANYPILKGPNYKGVIFPKDYNEQLMLGPIEVRFTPLKEDIEIFEKNLKKQIRSINKLKPNQGKDLGPIIHKNLGKYIRQYAGHLDKNGDRLLLVNFIRKPNFFNRLFGIYDFTKDWQEQWITILDGGSNYWTIEYNLDNGNFQNFYVNGPA
jgi:hypothetical protein